MLHVHIDARLKYQKVADFKSYVGSVGTDVELITSEGPDHTKVMITETKRSGNELVGGF